jgi:hypothetical protein
MEDLVNTSALFSPVFQLFTPEKAMLKVNTVNVLKSLGMQPADADDYLLQLMEHHIEESLRLARPLAGFAIFKEPQFDLQKHRLKVNAVTLSVDKIITRQLKNSTFLAVFVVTIGDEVERWSKQEMKAGNSLEGYLIDLIASELAESATDLLHDHLQLLAADQGLGITNRFSPGYCHWPVSEQPQLFSLLGEAPCGITLNPSSLMHPVKSVSGILGLGKGMKRLDYKCRVCTDKHCILRQQFD